MPRGRRPVTAPPASFAISRTSRAAPAASFAAAFTRAAPISTSALAGGACAGVDGKVGDGGAPDEVWTARCRARHPWPRPCVGLVELRDEDAGSFWIGGRRAALVASVEALRDGWCALGEVRVEQAERHFTAAKKTREA